MATTLDRARWHPLVLLPFEGPLADDLRAAGIEVLTGEVAVLRREALTPLGLSRLARQVAYERHGLERLIAAQRIDVVHANTSVILGLRRTARRLVVHVREIYPEVPLAWPLHRRGILRADRVLCVSEAVRAQFGGAPHAAVVPDGLAVTPARAARGPARMTLGLPQDGFVAGVVGRLSSWKGQEVLVRALAPGMSGLVAGDVWPGQERWEQALRTVIAETGADVRLAGFRADVENVYGAADVVVVPSTSPDPLPNSALEAAAAGCCVVAAAHGGLPEIIRDGETGRLVAPGDVGALRAVLEELRDDPEQRARLGAAAAADVRERFTPGRLASRVMAVYDALI